MGNNVNEEVIVQFAGTIKKIQVNPINQKIEYHIEEKDRSVFAVVHEQQIVLNCVDCGRIFSREDLYYNNEGRRLCKQCFDYDNTRKNI